MSAEVAFQKFSFPFACVVKVSPQEKVTQKDCVQKPELPKENQNCSEPSSVRIVGALLHDENAAAAKASVCTEAPHGVLENLRVESEDQRPAAKRQLSSESAARSITAVKKSTVRKETDEQKPGRRVPPNAAGSRKRRKDLFTSSDIFHRLDSQVIRTGAEVRTLRRRLCLNLRGVKSSFDYLVKTEESKLNVLWMRVLQLKEKCVHDVKTIVQSITRGARNELERLRAIWVWLCHNIGGFTETPSMHRGILGHGAVYLLLSA